MERLNELLIKPKPKSQNSFKFNTGDINQENTFIVDNRETFQQVDVDNMLNLIHKIKKRKSNIVNYETIRVKIFFKNFDYEEYYLPFDNVITNIVNTGFKMKITINVKPDKSENQKKLIKQNQKPQKM